MLGQKRIYIFTGKGGVGKTTLSLALTKHLADSGKKVLFCEFDQQSVKPLAQKLNIPYLNLEINSSAEEYVGNKLGSKTVAHWIMKTPFFSALFKMVPGLANMILLGHMIDMLLHDEDLTIVLDSPSSGHALTMLESPFNFKEMFGSGIIVNDIERMEKFINREDGFLISVISLPSLMAVTEAKELQSGITKLGYKNTQVIANDLYALTSDIKDNIDSLPDFMKMKIDLEKEVIKNLNTTASIEVPHIFNNEMENVVKILAPIMGGKI